MKNFFLLFILSGIFLTAACKPKAELPQTTADPQTERELELCRDQVNKLQSQLSSAEASAQELNDRILQMEGEKVNLQDQLNSLQSSLADVSQEMEATSDDFGVWFRVQIGAYEERQIDQNLQTTEGLGLEQKDQLQKIVLGRFRSYDDARRLQQHLMAIGLKDAWIASYKDGLRVPIAEARN